MRNYVRIPQEKYEALRAINPGLAARMLDEEVQYGTGASNWLAEFIAGSPAAANRFKMAGQLFRPSAFKVALDSQIAADWQTWMGIGSFEPVEGELACIIAAKSWPRFYEFEQAVSDIRRSPAWTAGFRPPWTAVLAVARIATILTWPMPVPAAKPAAAPAAEPIAAPAAEPIAAPAEPKPAVAPAAKPRPRKRAR